jgi:hypothetical protein
MLTTLIMLVALAGLALIVFLVLSGVDESETWVARTRRRVRGQRAELLQSSGDGTEENRREHLEREHIERRLERERARATLQDPQ